MTDKEALTQLFGEHSGSRISHTFKTTDRYDVYTVIVDRNTKPKRYVLPMPYGADDDDPDDSHYAVVNRQYHAGPAWHQGPCVSFKEAREHYSVTQAEIDAAPDWVKAIKAVEVNDND